MSILGFTVDPFWVQAVIFVAVVLVAFALVAHGNRKDAR